MQAKRAISLNDYAFAPNVSGQAKILFKNATLATSDGAQWHVHEHTHVTVQGAEIVATGKPQSADLEIDATGYLIMPGLINAHTHAPMTFFRGLGHAQKHANMIEDFMFPAERSLTPELVEPLSYGYIVSALKSGTTCINDHYYFAAGVGAACKKLGLRVFLGETLADLNGAFCGAENMQRARELTYDHELIHPILAPHAADTISRAYIQDILALRKETGWRTHMHLSQTAGEFARVAEREQCTPVEYAHTCKLLGPETIAVHLISATAADLDILRKTGTHVVVCPASQLVYEHLAPVTDMIAKEIALSLATDCAASNDTADLWSEMRLFAFLLKDLRRRATGAQAELLTAKLSDPGFILDMVTCNPARALGREGKLGVVKAGAAADLCFLKLDLSMHPTHDLLTNLVYSASSRLVEHVMVAGQWSVWRGDLVRADEQDLTQAMLAATKTLTAKTHAPRR